VQDLPLFVFAYFKDDRIHPVTHPADGDILLRDIRPLVEPIRPSEQIPRLLEPNAPPRILLSGARFFWDRS
jgi:hypothetical protein